MLELLASAPPAAGNAASNLTSISKGNAALYGFIGSLIGGVFSLGGNVGVRFFVKRKEEEARVRREERTRALFIANLTEIRKMTYIVKSDDGEAARRSPR